MSSAATLSHSPAFSPPKSAATTAVSPPRRRGRAERRPRAPPGLPAPARGPLPRAPRPLGLPEARAARSRRRLAPQWPERRRRRRAATPSRARYRRRPCAPRPVPRPCPRLSSWLWGPAAAPPAGTRQRERRRGPVSAASAMAARASAKQGRGSSWAGAHWQVGPGCQPPFLCFQFCVFILFRLKVHNCVENHREM